MGAIFLTVGTVAPFDRLVRAVDDAVATGLIEGPVFGQIGRTSYRPKHIACVGSLPKAEFDRYVAEADFLIGHAGIGTMIAAFEAGKRLIVMPRRIEYGELVSDHQTEIARRFAELGHLLVAHEPADLPAQLIAVKSFVPVPRLSRAADVAQAIGRCFGDSGAAPRPRRLLGRAKEVAGVLLLAPFCVFGLAVWVALEKRWDRHCLRATSARDYRHQLCARVGD